MQNEEEQRTTDNRASANEGAGMQKEPDTANQEPTSLEAQLAEEKEKAQSYLTSWQRAAADYQNLKRRVDQEREELSRFGNIALLMNFLPLVDDMERALASVDERVAGSNWLDGIKLIQRKFQQLLDANGVTEIAAANENFDPNLHEAVMFGEGEDGKVINVVQKGYKLGARVLRPSMVVVGKKG